MMLCSPQAVRTQAEGGSEKLSNGSFVSDLLSSKVSCNDLLSSKVSYNDFDSISRLR